MEVRPIRGQVDDLLHEIRLRAEKNERVLVTTLTKRMSEDLAEHYTEAGVKCAYLHSEVSTLDRVKILRDLRRGTYDVLIGVNLLREGLDLPEVSLVAILDADKEGFLRSAGSLIQTMGRAARHLNGRAILYADVMTDSMRRAIGRNHAAAHDSVARTTKRTISRRNRSSSRSISILVAVAEADYVTVPLESDEEIAAIPPEQMDKYLAELEERMREAARKFDFKQAAAFRDRIKELRAKAVLSDTATT